MPEIKIDAERRISTAGIFLINGWLFRLIPLEQWVELGLGRGEVDSSIAFGRAWARQRIGIILYRVG